MGTIDGQSCDLLNGGIFVGIGNVVEKHAPTNCVVETAASRCKTTYTHPVPFKAYFCL